MAAHAHTNARYAALQQRCRPRFVCARGSAAVRGRRLVQPSLATNLRGVCILREYEPAQLKKNKNNCRFFRSLLVPVHTGRGSTRLQDAPLGGRAGAAGRPRVAQGWHLLAGLPRVAWLPCDDVLASMPSAEAGRPAHMQASMRLHCPGVIRRNLSARRSASQTIESSSGRRGSWRSNSLHAGEKGCPAWAKPRERTGASSKRSWGR